MGGQVLGGGVVVLVAVVLWLVYLLPSWHSRHQYNAAERNAVRLNQALRVLAETSETPEEVRLELNARSALAQQKLARRAQLDRDDAQQAQARAEQDVERARLKAETAAALARAQVETEAARARAQAETAAARAQAQAESSAARAMAVQAREKARAEAAAARALPAARRARARRRARLITTIVALAALAMAAWGVVELLRTGAQMLLWASGAVALVCAMMLQRMSTVQRRALRTVDVAAVEERPERVATAMQDVALDGDSAGWMPRELPRPLTASAGSRAAAVLDQAAAQEALRQAPIAEVIRERADAAAPPSIDVARRTRRDAPAASAGDDAIEAHVRDLLQRRASGQ